MPEQILDSDDLLRRVVFDSIDPLYIRPDQTVTSVAFLPRKIDGVLESGLSVDISKLTTYEQSIRDIGKYRLYSLKAGYVRQINLECVHDPLVDNIAHALIIGDIKKSKAKQLSIGATRVQYP
jgi:hypothetical protein